MLVWDLVLFPQRQTRSVCLVFSNQRFVNSCLANKCLYKHSYTYLRAINLSFNCNVYDPLLLHILRFQKFITMFSFLSFFFLASGNYRILNETDRKNDYHCPQMRWPLAKGLVQVYGCGRYKNASPSRPYITLWDGCNWVAQAAVILQWIKVLSDAECVFIGLDEIEGAENMIGRACGLVIFVS